MPIYNKCKGNWIRGSWTSGTAGHGRLRAPQQSRRTDRVPVSASLERSSSSPSASPRPAPRQRAFGKCRAASSNVTKPSRRAREGRPKGPALSALNLMPVPRASRWIASPDERQDGLPPRRNGHSLGLHRRVLSSEPVRDAAWTTSHGLFHRDAGRPERHRHSPGVLPIRRAGITAAGSGNPSTTKPMRRDHPSSSRGRSTLALRPRRTSARTTPHAHISS
jgi:hypothetical protein